MQSVLELHETASMSPLALMAEGLGTIAQAGPAADAGMRPAKRLMRAAQTIPNGRLKAALPLMTEPPSPTPVTSRAPEEVTLVQAKPVRKTAAAFL